jgi:UDP-N-acetylenolpyruvoylglucosamine reductase
MDTALLTQLEKAYTGRVKPGEPMSRHTTLKIGGPADAFIEAKTPQELADIVLLARKLSIQFFILGGGSNILIGDKGFRGLVIKNNSARILTKGIKGKMRGSDTHSIAYVEADSGVMFNSLVRYTLEDGLSGLEMHLGLPGTVGGAIYMNSKWARSTAYVGDAVFQAEILTPQNIIRSVPQHYFRFGSNASSIQKTHDIVLRVVFALHSKSKDEVWNVANESIVYRQRTQPRGVFSAGCTFRNISGADVMALGLPKEAISAGYLIDHSGLKGEKAGDAQISNDHANFIINRGHARASDVIELMSRARDQVKKQFNIELTEEIVRVGEF